MHNIGLFKSDRNTNKSSVTGTFIPLETLEEDEDRSSNFMNEKFSQLYEEKRSNFQKETLAKMESTITSQRIKDGGKELRNQATGGVAANAYEITYPLIFGGLNTEKMNEFMVYFPYNNCKEVIQFVNFQNKSRRKSTKNIKKTESTTPKVTNNQNPMVLGMINFKNQQRIFLRSIINRRKGKEKSVIKKLFN